MDIWVHRPAFVERVSIYRKAEGIKLSDVAERLGIKESTLKDYLYREDVRPSLEVMTKAAVIFGCSILEFIDDPGAQVPGLGPDDMNELSAAKRAVMNMMFQRLKKEDVTDEGAMTYLKALDAMIELGEVRKPKWR